MGNKTFSFGVNCIITGKETRQRKIDTQTWGWRKETDWDFSKKSMKKLINYMNSCHTSSSLFDKEGRGGFYWKPSSLMMIDCDHEDHHKKVEEILRKKGLAFVKTPSASYAKGEVEYKWHFFLFMKKDFHDNLGMAKQQILDVYNKLGITDICDTRVMNNPVGYFSPAGASEEKSKLDDYGDRRTLLAFTKRVEECNNISFYHKGKLCKMPKADSSKIKTVCKGTIAELSKDIPTKWRAGSPFKLQMMIGAKTKTLPMTRKDGTKGAFDIMDHDYPIHIGGGECVSIDDIIAFMRKNEITNLSNQLPCPFGNTKHDSGSDGSWLKEGYGYITLYDGVYDDYGEQAHIKVACGGDACKGRQITKQFKGIKNGSN